MFSFRELPGQDIPDPYRIKRHGLSFFLSLLFHGLIFFLVFLLFPPLKSDFGDRKVADVIIVPPEKLFLPGSAQNLRVSSDITKDNPAPFTSLPADPGAASAPPDSLRFDPALSAQFRLVLPKNIDTDELDSDFEFDLSQDRENRFFPMIPEPKTDKQIDLSQYSASAYSADYRARYFGSRRQKSSRVSALGAVSVKGKPYDISPWANKVVAEIQKNWFLSPQQNEVFSGRVEISVIIERSGEVRSVEVLDSSRIEVFDRAALNAIEIAPFPQLPSDFPVDQLQISLVFLVQ